LQQISVCGSDVHLSFAANLPEEMYPLPPGRPGHECAGVVTKSRNPRFPDGTRVIVVPRDYDGLREFVVGDDRSLVALPDAGGLDEWVLCQPAGTVLYATKHWGVAAGRTVAILGQGSIGLCFTMMAERMGAERILAIDLEEYRLARALEFGATHTVNPSLEDSVKAVEEVTRGDGADIVVDASADPRGLDIALHLVKRGGTVIGFSLIGLNATATFHHLDWMRKAARIVPTSLRGSGEVNEIREMVELRKRGWIDPGRLKTHTMSWSRIQEAFELYEARRDGVIKVIMSVP
jgi:threonine dehydrogenase-like Zn-dependent dehydrogenase